MGRDQSPILLRSDITVSEKLRWSWQRSPHGKLSQNTIPNPPRGWPPYQTWVQCGLWVCIKVGLSRLCSAATPLANFEKRSFIHTQRRQNRQNQLLTYGHLALTVSHLGPPYVFGDPEPYYVNVFQLYLMHILHGKNCLIKERQRTRRMRIN